MASASILLPRFKFGLLLLMGIAAAVAVGVARHGGPATARADAVGARDRAGLRATTRHAALADALRLRFEEPRMAAGVMPRVVRYTLTNTLTDQQFNYSAGEPRHNFARVDVTYGGERLPLKEDRPLRYKVGGPSNYYQLDPGQDTWAAFPLDDLYDLTRPGTYRVRASTSVTLWPLGRAGDEYEDSGEIRSNELTFTVPAQ